MTGKRCAVCGSSAHRTPLEFKVMAGVWALIPLLTLLVIVVINVLEPGR